MKYKYKLVTKALTFLIKGINILLNLTKRIIILTVEET
jgi:hypothetical protein